MSSLFDNWVLYREDSNTHEEIYVVAVGHKFNDAVLSTDAPEGARHFATAAEAYHYASAHAALQWWRVGKR